MLTCHAHVPEARLASGHPEGCGRVTYPCVVCNARYKGLCNARHKGLCKACVCESCVCKACVWHCPTYVAHVGHTRVDACFFNKRWLVLILFLNKFPWTGKVEIAEFLRQFDWLRNHTFFRIIVTKFHIPAHGKVFS